ncbi:IucA/IucC family protein [Xanthomonas graminis]|uniref:Iron transporter n=1 Tax=Xanthomonas graminis pv. poae TaxID=227946 RepID=A0A199P9C3_9XANT|nr:IucA/IucC family protein [Xanthomonas translucens]OAX57508.1 iron transporter [Xanthomonas translucens pv. poae]
MFQHGIRDQWHEAQAQAQAISCWLNCYLREFALPREQADFNYRGLDAPAALLHGERQQLLRIRFAEAGYLICARVVRTSMLGRCEYQSAPYLKSPGNPWRCADANAIAHFLLERLAPECGFNAELLAQSQNSVAITAQLLRLAKQAEVDDAVACGDALIEAEQAMLWGHALHPTPKSREGVPLAQVLACAPEARSQFPLFWFRIDPRLYRAQGQDVRATLAQAGGAADLYPCHPWEAERVLAHPLLRQAQARGWIEPLGERGLALRPTSSVRTLYHAELDYFLKLSVHVRLTNCVRKNAWYELESAVALTRLLAPVWRALAKRVPGFQVLLEPAATDLDFSALDGDAQACRALGESFGMLYRQAIPAAQRVRFQPQVAGALFTRDARGDAACAAPLQALARRYGSLDAATAAWFHAYARLLLDGVWSAWFDYGIALEPHLQNTVIGSVDGLPARVWIRDLEGTKLLPARWPAARLHGTSETARQSLYYSAEQGWNRIAYCALVNNLAEAIFHLADGHERRERQLWRIVGTIAQAWQQRHGRQPALQALLDGAPLPAKNNLRLRLLQRADRHADYTLLPNPIARPAQRQAAA